MKTLRVFLRRYTISLHRIESQAFVGLSAPQKNQVLQEIWLEYHYKLQAQETL